MDEIIRILIDGESVSVSRDITVAAALLNAGKIRLRESVTGDPRGPLCGMGICFDCRVTIGEEQHVRACLVKVRDGMEVSTGS
jgi:hypothetical protein